MTLKLYTLCGADTARHFSPHVWKTVMSLHHKGLDFEECPTPFTAIPEIEGGATKTVPLLVDGDTMIVDSFAIAEYLEETTAPRLHPADPIQRARNRAWTDFVPDFSAALNKIGYAKTKEAMEEGLAAAPKVMVNARPPSQLADVFCFMVYSLWVFGRVPRKPR